MKSHNFDAARISLTGDRKSNQDRSLLLCVGATAILALADGLGGHPRGEIASQLFVDVCESLFRRSGKPLQDPGQFMRQCIHKAHEAIVQFSNRQAPPCCPRTTAVMAVLQNGAAYWAHVGDSRLYLLRNGQVHSRTDDHSRIRRIRPAHGTDSRTRCSITRCLGGLDKPPAVSLGPPTELRSGDTILLCSDGLWGQVPQRKILHMLSVENDIGNAIGELAEEAAHRGYPHSDNVTAVGLRWAPGMREKNKADRAEHHHEQIAKMVRHLHSVPDPTRHKQRT